MKELMAMSSAAVPVHKKGSKEGLQGLSDSNYGGLEMSAGEDGEEENEVEQEQVEEQGEEENLKSWEPNQGESSNTKRPEVTEFEEEDEEDEEDEIDLC